MNGIVEVGLKMLDVANEKKFKWERAEDEMCYQTEIATCAVIVKKDMFQVRNIDGVELDTVTASFGGDDHWIHKLWRRAHLAVLEQERVFEEMLEQLGSDD